MFLHALFNQVERSQIMNEFLMRLLTVFFICLLHFSRALCP